MIPPDFEIIQDCSIWQQSPLEDILLKMMRAAAGE